MWTSKRATDVKFDLSQPGLNVIASVVEGREGKVGAVDKGKKRRGANVKSRGRHVTIRYDIWHATRRRYRTYAPASSFPTPSVINLYSLVINGRHLERWYRRNTLLQRNHL